ncbi:MAG: hypothetical protein ACLPSF_13275 [Methylocella sp.]
MASRAAGALALLGALATPAIADPSAPAGFLGAKAPGMAASGPGPGRIFGYFDPAAGMFTPTENPKASAVKPVAGTLTVNLNYDVSEKDPKGTIFCYVDVETKNGESESGPEQNGPATSGTFVYSFKFLVPPPELAVAVHADCAAQTKYGSQSGALDDSISIGVGSNNSFPLVELQ